MAHVDQQTLQRCPSQICEAFEVVGGSLSNGLVLLCDHASNWLPENYRTLGLSKEQLNRHIGYDIGCETVTRTMAERLNAPAILSRFSRLLIDPNRGSDDPTLIMKLSDRTVIPGNAQISSEERDYRLANYYQPYHAAIKQTLDLFKKTDVTPILVSIHSFTDNWEGMDRPWHLAILWDKDDRLAAPLISSLSSDPALVVGDNEPYTGRLKGDCMNKHGTQNGYPHALIEIRQDLIASPDGQAEWSELLASHIEDLLKDEELRARLNEVRHFGSHSDQARRR